MPKPEHGGHKGRPVAPRQTVPNGKRLGSPSHRNSLKSPIHTEMKSRLFAWKNSSIDPLKKFHKFLHKLFHRMGQTVALHPSYFIIFPIFLTILGGTGFQRIRNEDDPELLFYPATGPAPKERSVFEHFFPINYSSEFQPQHMTQASGFARLLIKPHDHGKALREDVWRDLELIDYLIRDISVELKGRVYKYDDLCARFAGSCHANRILDLNELMPQIENGSLFINYPIMFYPFILPFDFGGLVVDEEKGQILNATSLSLSYFLKQDTAEDIELALLWEQEFLHEMATKHFETVQVSYFAARSRKDEMLNNTNSIRPYASITGLLMMFFSIGSVITADWVRGKIYLGIIGVASAGMATLAAFGFLMYLSVPFISINKIIPFLMIGIGIDDMFVVLASWRRTHIQDPISKRLSETYTDAGISITITSLTNMLSFSVGILTPILGVQIFCIYTTLSVLLTYLWHLTFFGGCLAIAGYFESTQRHSLLCFKVKAKSEAEEEGTSCYSIFCAGGINPDDQWNERDNRPHMIMVAFRDHFGTLLNYPFVKAMVFCLFLAYLGGAIYGCTTLKEGLDRKHVVRHDSYAVDYYNLEAEEFRKFPYVIQIAITNDTLDYSSLENREKLLKLHDDFESLPFSAESIFTRSWIREFYRFIDKNPEVRQNIVDETSFISELRSKFFSGSEHLDVTFNEDLTKILASRITIQTYEITDTHKETAMVKEYRRIALESQLNVTVFNPNFILFDQYTMVKPITIQAISIAVVAMVGISLIFIPNPWCSLLVGLAIVSIETGVVGYMALWGVNLDQISMINLIMCIGFSVDFSAHISYAYLTARVESPEEKLRECLYSLGLPIVQGGMSTVVCIVTFLLAPSYVYVTFFKIVFLVVFFATMHGLLLIPVLLSVFGQRSTRKKELCKAEIKIPRVKLNSKPITYDVETGITRPKKSPKASGDRWNSDSKNNSSGSRPDPEGCSNRSFGKDSEKSSGQKDR